MTEVATRERFERAATWPVKRVVSATVETGERPRSLEEALLVPAYLEFPDGSFRALADSNDDDVARAIEHERDLAESSPHAIDRELSRYRATGFAAVHAILAEGHAIRVYGPGGLPAD
ncbi:MAG TPA: hypothetical protein VHQ89_07220 [Gaiellaceae bacterium]|jgi:hypothetical protein|nr:hypothetical protein [Gaiellaceae bacterium]